MRQYAQQFFPLLFVFLSIGVCKKSEESTGLPQTEKVTPSRADSSAARVDLRARGLLIKTVRGVLYTSGKDSLTSLAVETGEGTVLLLTGPKAATLRAHQHQKVMLTGFWHPASGSSARDTLEVVDYSFLRD